MLKRILDIVLALALGIAALPFLALISLAILATMGRPIFFRQQRLGLGGTEFSILKFRTMARVDGRVRILDDSLRVTPLGRLLRMSSLDELPQLWNILIGDMSLVGPRPMLAQFRPYYTPEQMRRHEVRPGLTGLAQVNGRNRISWEERLAIDLWYVTHRSLWLDLKILLRTPLAVLSAKGQDSADWLPAAEQAPAPAGVRPEPLPAPAERSGKWGFGVHGEGAGAWAASSRPHLEPNPARPPRPRELQTS